MNTYEWEVDHDEKATFHIYDINAATNWKSDGGLYIFAGDKGGHWFAYYVGQTEDLKDRIPTHERKDEAVRLGATHVHVRLEPQAATREKREDFLIQYLQPPLNKQGL